MNKTLILVVEDDRPIRNLIVTTLKTHDYKYLAAENGSSAILEASSHNPDIVLLDLGLPDMEGVEVIKKIRTWSNMPIIVISARSEDTDKIEALDAGADDYITKPFGIRELMAKIEANLRREQRMQCIQVERKRTRLYFGNLTLDMQGRSVRIGEKEIPLTRTEYDIVEFLALHAGQVFTKEQIYECVWGYDGTGDNTTVVERIKKIRGKFAEAESGIQYISTVWGIGYKWN